MKSHCVILFLQSLASESYEKQTESSKNGSDWDVGTNQKNCAENTIKRHTRGMRAMVKVPLVFSWRKELIMNYIKAFESHLREQGKAEKTISSYTGDTMRFLTYLKSKELSFDGTLNRFTINSYKNHLFKENYEPAIINRNTCCWDNVEHSVVMPLTEYFQKSQKKRIWGKSSKHMLIIEFDDDF